MRNRRYTLRKGPLVVTADTSSACAKAFRNLPGVEVACVNSLNLLQVCVDAAFGFACAWSGLFKVCLHFSLLNEHTTRA